MLHILPESQKYILGVKATGKFTNQDYREFLIPRLNDLVKEHGQVRLLLYLDENFQGFEREAILNEPFSQKQKDNFQRIAMVGGSW